MNVRNSLRAMKKSTGRTDRPPPRADLRHQQENPRMKARQG